ncbi:putative secreted protein (Por secretion system target), partial [Winogradskyella wandonensis]
CEATGVTLGTPTTADNCGVATVTNDAPATFPLGTTTVTWTVTDNAGLTATATQSVTVNDTTAPVITLNGNATVNVEACTGIYTEQGATVADCETGLSVTIGGDTVDVNTPGTYIITYNVTDTAGNAATQVTRDVIVADNTNPICSTQDITIQLDGTGNATITANDIDNGSSDNCGVASISVSQTAFTSADIGDNIVTFTVTDVNGNSSTCNATVTVENSTLDIDDDKFEVFGISPNPFKDNLIIKVPAKLSGDTFNIVIYDLNGRRVFNEVKSVVNNEINLTGLSRLEIAPYIIRIINSTSNSVYSKRLIRY